MFVNDASTPGASTCPSADGDVVIVYGLSLAEIENVLATAFPDRPDLRCRRMGTSPTFSMQALMLSTREVQILRLIAQTLTNEQIAAKLFLSPNTVKTYIRSAYRKIDVNTRPQAIRWCITHILDLSADN